MGHRTYLAAVADAQECFCDEDVDAVWVTRNLTAASPARSSSPVHRTRRLLDVRLAAG
jgi:hypothetical protein